MSDVRARRAFDETLWCQTYSGQRAHVCNLAPEQINLLDIAHSLTLQRRFGGHSREPWSVAEHSMLVAWIVEHKLGRADLVPQALLHDASEAYLVDVPRPAKCSRFLDGYRTLEGDVSARVLARFGLPTKLDAAVKVADEIALATEADRFMQPYAADWCLREEPLSRSEIELIPGDWRVVRERFLGALGAYFRFSATTERQIQEAVR